MIPPGLCKVHEYVEFQARYQCIHALTRCRNPKPIRDIGDPLQKAIILHGQYIGRSNLMDYLTLLSKFWTSRRPYTSTTHQSILGSLPRLVKRAFVQCSACLCLVTAVRLLPPFLSPLTVRSHQMLSSNLRSCVNKQASVSRTLCYSGQFSLVQRIT